MSHTATMDSAQLGDRVRFWSKSMPNLKRLYTIGYPSVLAGVATAILIYFSGIDNSQNILEAHMDRNPTSPIYFDANGDGRLDRHTTELIPSGISHEIVDVVHLAGNGNGQGSYFHP